MVSLLINDGNLLIKDRGYRMVSLLIKDRRQKWSGS